MMMMRRSLRVRARAFRPPDHGIRDVIQIMVLNALQIMELAAVPPARLPVLFCSALRTPV